MSTTFPASIQTFAAPAPTLGDTLTAVQARALLVRNVKDFGAVGDGVTNDRDAIQNLLDALGEFDTLWFPPGNYVINGTLNVPVSNVSLVGPAKIVAQNGTSFEYMLLVNSKSGVTVRELEFDANQANRSSGQTIRFMAAGFIACSDCSFLRCTARNTRGYNSVPAVGLAIGGASIRCRVDSCLLVDCGGNPTLGLGSDGVFTSGDQNVISNCIATNCTDTGFVIESSNQSIITGCTTLDCNAGAAITNATSSTKSGNIINGLTVKNWSSSVTGGIQIGVPTSDSGNLVDTEVCGVVMYAETAAPASRGVGPAINVRTQGAGRAVGVSIASCRIEGATAQGILINGDEVTVVGCAVKGTGASCVQFQGGSNGHAANNYLKGGTFGVTAATTASVVAQSNACVTQSNTGIYASGTSSITSILNTIVSPASNYEAKDVGATLNLFGHRAGNLATTNITTAAVSGAQTKKLAVYDNTGSLVGTIPLYAS